MSGGNVHALSRLVRACLAAVLLNSASVAAGEVLVAGIPVADQTTVAGQRLLLNGVGVRTLLGFRVYVASLYLPSPMRDTARILDKDTAKSLQVTLLRDTSTDQNIDALKGGLIDNNSPAELDAIQREIDLFFALVKQVHEVPTGTRIQLDYRPGEGTRLKIGGRELGVIPGDRFSRAILKIWLGGDPIQLSLKHLLLGMESSAL